MPIGNGGIIGPANVPTITTASGVWSLREQQQAQGRGAWPLALTPDPYFEYTTLLLPGNGTDGANNNTFLDSGTANSGSGFTITRNGNTTQGTFSPFSQTGWGNYFDGNGTTTTNTDSLSIADNTALELSNVDFTIESWVYLTADLTTTVRICDKDNGTTVSYLFYLTTTKALGFQFSTDGSTTTTLTSSGTIALNVWNHVAITRSGNDFTFWINGESKGVSTNNVTIYNSSANLIIGNTANINIPNQRAFPGYISNFRIVKGVAVYTGNFTPPTSPLERTQSAGTNISAITGTQTSLLTCQSNRFIDNSSNNFTITRNGDTRVVAFSPFNPTLPWIASINGGSGYFDGSGDYLSAANNAAFNFGSGLFTIELWYYPTTLSGTQCLITNYGGSTTGFAVQMGGSTVGSGKIDVNLSGDGADITSTNAVQLNSWNHIAISGTPGATGIKLFINGNQEGSTYTGATSLDTSATLFIGQIASTNRLSGYLSGLRLLKGTAQYTAAFTPPTAPPTAITNTSLLLNFTNAGIYDATSKNDLETLDNTVNGVRISTAQSQFGGSSIYFDGTGTDYLWIQADQPIQRFGTAPFTIELWIRLAATGSARGLVAKGTSTTGWLVSLNSSNQVVFTYGTSTITSTGTISAGVWTYIAVVREGTGANQTKIYIGGVNDGTGTVSTDFTQTSSMYIGADRTGGSLFSGYMQDVRITNGYARTVTTIPTTAFPTL